jgi:steroid delta-isomerase-like uncharacterized protein
MSEDNKAVVHRFIQAFNQGDLETVGELVAEDFSYHDPALPSGREGAKQVMMMFRTAFPDAKLTLEDVIAEGDKVVARNTFTGTHQAEFMGIPPTGKQVSIMEIDIARIEDGKLAEHWGLADTMSMMAQLGVDSM